ncbi:MAG: NUDIX hydrolase [Anaerolineae bacterium]|nr:NUDIX hydrolase [Anaerolineae bacterium]
MHPWKTQARRVLLDASPWLVVENHVIELPSGQVISDWTWVDTPDFINVVVEMADGTFQFFRQWKYGFDRISLAPIGGYLEPGELPIEAAKRELREEMGCEASEWVDLGRYRIDANRGAGMGNLFLARGAQQVAAPTGGDLEEQTLVRLSRAEVLAALRSGEFRGMAWAANVGLALLWG